MLKLKKIDLENIFYSLIFFSSILISQNSFAADSLSYSGRLVKADGSPVAGPVNLTIDLAYTNTPGTILCSQNFSSVALSNGVFHLKLDLVCPGPPVKTLTEILTAVPANFAAALRVSDLSNSKIYAFQEIHSMPFATVSESAKQLAQLGALNGEVLKWNETSKKWEPSAAGGGGTVTNLTVTSPLAVVNGATTPALSIAQATATVDGYLSSADWNTFNNKLGVAAGGNAAQFYRGDKSWQTLNTDAVPDAGMTNLYFTNARALGVPLGASLDVALLGPITSADSILSAFGRTQNQINSINSNSSGYVTKMGTSTMVAAGTIDAQAGFVLVGAPGSINDATPRGYVDTQVGLKLSKAGDMMTGALTLNGDLLIKGGSNYVTLKGHATSDNYNLFLPSTDGNPGEVLKTDGAGNLAWINPASVAAGSATVDSAAIVNGTIVDADIANTTISYAKLSLTDGDIPLAKLNGVSDATKYLRADKSWQTLNGAAVANTPAGSIAATSTQAALNELDTEKEAAVTAGLATDYYKGNKTWSNLGTDVRASQLTGLAAGTNTALVATDSILTAFQNTQAQINSKQNTISKTTDQDLKSVRLYGANATNYVELTAGALTANRSLIFPDANGSSGQVLTTNGTGVLSWTTAATTGSAVGGDLSGTIANAQLGAGVVGNTELAADAVTSAKILDGTIVNADLANTTVTYAKLNLTDGDIPLAKLNGASDATKYLRGDKSWSTFATDAIASALAGFTPFATKTDIVAGDSIFTAFQKTQKQLDDIDGDYVSKSGNNTVTGTFNISGITAFLNIPTPNGTTLNEAANVDYVKTYVGSMGQWTKGTGGNAADIYFNTGKVGIGLINPSTRLEVLTSTITDGAFNKAITVGTSASGGQGGWIGSRTASANQRQGLMLSSSQTLTLHGDNAGDGSSVLDIIGGATPDIAGDTNLLLRVNSNGNVGVGTSTPDRKFQVTKVNASSSIRLDGFTAGTNMTPVMGPGSDFGSLIEGADNGQVVLALRDNDNNDGFRILSGGGNFMTDSVYDTAVFSALSNGNVGIGTSSPTNRLTVKAVSNAVTDYPIQMHNLSDTMRTGHGTYGMSNKIGTAQTIDYTYDIGGAQIFNTGGAERLRILGTGNVGVGTNNPTGKFEVDLTDNTEHASVFIGDPTTGGNPVNTPITKIANRWFSTETANISFWRKGSSNDGGAISFRTTPNTTAPVDRLYIESNGNVGIGTTNPYAPLSVFGDAALDSAGVTDRLFYFRNQNTVGTIQSDKALRINTNNTEAVRILMNGNVGIGTANPTSKLFVNAAANAGPSGLVIDGKTRQASETNVPLLQVDAGLAGANGTALWVNTAGNVGIGTTTPTAKLEVANSFKLSGATYPSLIIENNSKTAAGVARNWTLYNMSSATYSDGLEFWVYDTTGCAGGLCTPRFKLFDNGNAWLAGTLTQASDSRLKTNIKILPSSLEKIVQLQGVSYFWKDKLKDKNKQIGLIAQEVQKVYPEVVETGRNGLLSIAYQNLVAPIIESIKEISSWMTNTDKEMVNQKREIASLKARNEKLESENEAIKLRLENIEKSLKK